MRLKKSDLRSEVGSRGVAEAGDRENCERRSKDPSLFWSNADATSKQPSGCCANCWKEMRPPRVMITDKLASYGGKEGRHARH
jgi:hypothetical protein